MNFEGNRIQNEALIWDLIDQIHSKIQNHCSRKRFVAFILPFIVTENMVSLFCRISWRNTLQSRILWKEIILGFRQKCFTSLVFLPFKDTLSQLWLVWVMQSMKCCACGNRKKILLCLSNNCTAVERACNG